MPEQQLAIVTGPGRAVPARLTGMVLPLDIEIIHMTFAHPPQSDRWDVRLTVRVPTRERLDLLIARLNRLIDVIEVSATQSACCLAHAL
ncbi:hypothetical protein [Mycobacterium sp. GA-2829]|uniref:hypothetical protein n=1 Tax=Mycobacterium sp. GA-2829 TaxID=1772283 RepID=UPI00073FF4AA|nr:hypothetical protein [Mycobacterium sp. GA-2829]KUI39246.1 hypothetical protein AU194_14545 [Mycobacterium sp. GA-2829]